MNRSRACALTLSIFALSLSAANPPTTVTLFDSTAGAVGGDPDSIGQLGPYYASFSTPAGSTVYLSDVKVDIGNLGLGVADGQFTLTLYADTSNKPAVAPIATLATVSDASLPAAGTTVLMDFPVSPSIPLSAGTRYWIALGSKKNGTNAGWAWTRDTTGKGVIGEGNYYGGKYYDNVPDGPYSFKVVAQTTPTVGSMAQISSGGGWDTQLTLINKSSASADATLDFFDNNGNALELPFTFPQIMEAETNSTLTETLNPNQLLVLDTNDVTNTAGLTGSAQLPTPGGVDGFAIFRYTPTGQEAVVPLEQTVAPSYMLA